MKTITTTQALSENAIHESKFSDKRGTIRDILAVEVYRNIFKEQIKKLEI